MQCLVDSAKEYGLYPKSSRKPLKGFIQASNTTRGFFFSFFFFFLISQNYLGGEWTMGHQGWMWGDQVRGWAIMKVRENSRCGPEWPNQRTCSQ